MTTRGWQMALFLALVLCAASFADAQMAPTGETAVVTGVTWQQLNPNEKVAFVWGVGQLAAVEREVARRKGDAEGIGSRFAEGIKGVPMNEIVRKINLYYQDNPDQLNKPVLRVVWETVAKQNLAVNR